MDGTFMRRWQYVTDEGLILGYVSLVGPIAAEGLVMRLGKKRTTLLPKLYTLRDEGKLEQTTAGKARPYDLTDWGQRDVEKYHLADAVRAYLDDSGLTTPIKKEPRRLLETSEQQEISPTVKKRESVVEILPAMRSRAMKLPRKRTRGKVEPK